jgi:hypothetical protein
MLGKHRGTPRQPVHEALGIRRLVFGDVIIELLQTMAGFERPVSRHSGKPNCLRTVALSSMRPASLSRRPSSISCSGQLVDQVFPTGIIGQFVDEAVCGLFQARD